MSSTDTIFALSSGALPSGVAVIRLSGPHVRGAISALAGFVPAERMAVLRTLRNPAGDVIDRGLVVFFSGPGSFTGEDMAELHVHGGKAVVSAMLLVLGSHRGLRAAEAGEFTKRAFLNGKIDLLEAEALADLVSAETEFQRRFAVSSVGRAQSALYSGWRERLVRARAHIEAEVDFADEDDVPDEASAGVWTDLRGMVHEIERHIESFGQSEIIREGFDVVIVGPPNAGKSSLLNALAGRDVAIVTEEAGTTRDLVEVSLDLGGLKVRITDTAGIRGGAAKVEAIGIERALARASEADLVVELVPPGSGPLAEYAGPPQNRIRVRSKADLIETSSPDELAISTVSGKGMDDIVGRIQTAAHAAVSVTGNALPTRRRHVVLLREARECLVAATADDRVALELRAEDLRLASTAIGRLSGAIVTEDLLDVIFGEFCIGK